MKSTPIAMMGKTARVEPLESRRQAKLLTHAEKMKNVSDHPLHNRLQDLTKNRLKRKSFNHLVKQHQKRQTDIVTDNPELCERLWSTFSRRPSRHTFAKCFFQIIEDGDKLLFLESQISWQRKAETNIKYQPSSHLSYKETRTLICNRQKSTFIASIGGYNPQNDPFYQLSRHQQTTIFRLRTGYCELNGHLKKLVFSPRLYVIVGKMIKHQIISCSHVHSTTERGNTSGLLVP